MNPETNDISVWLSTSRTLREDIPGHLPEVMERLRLAYDMFKDHEFSAHGPELMYRTAAGELTRVPLTGQTLVAGRSAECGIAIEDDGLSRKHFELFVREGRVFIRDLKSRNGTYVNRAWILERELISGDVIEAGGIFFVFLNS